MEETKTNAGQGLGIAGLVLGILTLLIAFIPCVGLFALVPGAIAITFSFIALNQAKKANGSKGLIISALVISIVGTVIAVLWVLLFGTILNLGKSAIEKETGKSLQENIKEMGTDMEKTLEGLEKDSLTFKIEPGKPMSDADFNKFLDNYDKLIQESIKYHDAVKRGETNAAVAYSKVSVKLAQVVAKLAVAGPNFTKEQTQKLDDLNKKYKKQLDDMKE